jgi:hypothetical protein
VFAKSNVDRWQKKLRKLRQYLRGWNKNHASWYKKLKKGLVDKIDAIDITAESIGLTAHMLEEKRRLNDQLRNLL